MGRNTTGDRRRVIAAAGAAQGASGNISARGRRHSRQAESFMSHLHPCPGCDRHVSSQETTCPFCQAALIPTRICATGCSGPPAVRPLRVALMAAGAALLGAACQTQSVTPPYGIPPHFDAGTQSDGDAAEAIDAPPDAGD